MDAGGDRYDGIYEGESNMSEIFGAGSPPVVVILSGFLGDVL